MSLMCDDLDDAKCHCPTNFERGELLKGRAV